MQNYGQIVYKLLRYFSPFVQDDTFAFLLKKYIDDAGLFEGLDVENDTTSRRKARAILDDLFEDDASKEDLIEFCVSYIDNNY